MAYETYSVTIDGQTWTVTQDASGRIFATGPDGIGESFFTGSWNPIVAS